jgi:hypothetical protein
MRLLFRGTCMSDNTKLLMGISKLTPRRQWIYMYCHDYYEGYDEHWDLHQRLKYSRIYKIKHRNKKKYK